MTDNLPWHDGERAVQRRLGFVEGAERRGGNIRDFMPDQHRIFFAQLPFAVLATLDRAGDPWATLLSGPPGFLSSPDPKRLHIGAYPEEGDPAAAGIAAGERVALLGIELPTRRRNRMNGRVTDLDPSGFTVAVEQSFGNCPQYIQRRDYRARRPPRYPAVEPLARDDHWALDLIRGADTLFVASSTPPDEAISGGGVDVSHRGGRPGFVTIAGDGALEIPDYRGNRYFNTLGNLVAYPRAGLLFIDFDTGDVLQVTGAAKIVWDGPNVDALAGAERLWRVVPSRMVRLRGAFPLQLGEPEFSPLLTTPATA
ncbi:MAG TPA: pyridoxamine 5'-phosphate oxidase family protein [Stellaceae bacterium]|nr:pyridoxamine 5'-phosphate oxidase family protein [Stellaceae bacterium]